MLEEGEGKNKVGTKEGGRRRTREEAAYYYYYFSWVVRPTKINFPFTLSSHRPAVGGEVLNFTTFAATKRIAHG